MIYVLLYAILVTQAFIFLALVERRISGIREVNNFYIRLGRSIRKALRIK